MSGGDDKNKDNQVEQQRSLNFKDKTFQEEDKTNQQRIGFPHKSSQQALTFRYQYPDVLTSVEQSQ